MRVDHLWGCSESQCRAPEEVFGSNWVDSGGALCFVAPSFAVSNAIHSMIPIPGPHLYSIHLTSEHLYHVRVCYTHVGILLAVSDEVCSTHLRAKHKQMIRLSSLTHYGWHVCRYHLAAHVFCRMQAVTNSYAYVYPPQ